MGSPQTKRQILETVPGSQSPQMTLPLGCILLCSLLHINACMIENMCLQSEFKLDLIFFLIVLDQNISKMYKWLY